MSKLYIGVKEACERYSVSRPTLYRMFQYENCPPVMKLGGKTVLEVSAFDAFIKSELQPSVIEQNRTRRKIV